MWLTITRGIAQHIKLHAEEPRPLLDGDDPADVPLPGISLAHLLDAAMDADGDIAHLEVGGLADLVP